MISKPEKNEYPEWFAAEINLVPYTNLIYGLEDSFKKSLDFLKNIPEEKLEYSYKEGKWTIKEIWQHLLDVERILCYRALHYARQDINILHGFNENSYANVSCANKRSWDALIDEYIALRTSTLCLFKSFTEEMVMQKGTTGKSTMTVRAVGFLVLGHEIHHTQTINARYLHII